MNIGTVTKIDDGYVNNETGEMVSQDDYTDGLIEQLAFVSQQLTTLRSIEGSIKMALTEIASAVDTESNTRRVAGRNYVAKVEFKSKSSWDLGKLEFLRSEIGDKVFDNYFKVSEYKPVAKELKKLSSTAGEFAQSLFKSISTAKVTEPTRPSVSIEVGPMEGMPE